MFAWLFLSALFLTLPLWIRYPAWPADFMNQLAATPVWSQPNVFSISRDLLGANGLALYVIAAGALFLVNLWIWTRLPFQIAMVTSLAMTTIASPYIWTWDFVLLLPMLIYCYTHFETMQARIALIAGYVICWYLMFLTRTTGNNEQLFWWVPFAFLLIIGGATMVDTLAPRNSEVDNSVPAFLDSVR